MKIQSPIMADIIAKMSTADAEISFIFFALSSLLGKITSTIPSIAVLNNSADITTPNSNIQISHSIFVISNIHPLIITKNIMHICIFKFLSDFNAVKKPHIAYLKDLINLFIVITFLSYICNIFSVDTNNNTVTIIITINV